MTVFAMSGPSGKQVGACIFGCVVIIVFGILLGVSYQTLEPQEYGLLYMGHEMKVTDQQGQAYRSGREFTGLGNGFIRFPATVETFEFSNENPDSEEGAIVHVDGALTSRTRDGLSVMLEVSFQYQLDPFQLLTLYETLGEDYRPIFKKVAQSRMKIAATGHVAEAFFANRTHIGPLMETQLRSVFEQKLMAQLAGFQLKQVHLPENFEQAVQETQIQTQRINFVSATQKQVEVEKETELLRELDQVDVLLNDANAKAEKAVLEALAEANATVVDSNVTAADTRLKADAEAINLRLAKKYEAEALILEADAYARAVVLAAEAEAEAITETSNALVAAMNESAYRSALGLKKTWDAMGGDERKFLEAMQLRALEALNWEGMTMNLNALKTPFDLIDA